MITHERMNSPKTERLRQLTESISIQSPTLKDKLVRVFERKCTKYCQLASFFITEN